MSSMMARPPGKRFRVISMMAKRASGIPANIAILFGGLWCLTAHAADAGKKISLGSAVTIANRAVAKMRANGKFEPQRVEIAEDSERHMANRCLAEMSREPRKLAMIRAFAENSPTENIMS